MVHRTLVCLFAAFAIAVLVSFLAAVGWPLDLLAHFQAQYVLAGLSFAVGFAVCRTWSISALAICLSLVALVRMEVFDDGRFAASSDAAEPAISVATANLFGSAAALDNLIEENSARAFDLMILTELPVPADKALLDRFQGMLHVAGTPDQALGGRPAAIILSRIAPRSVDLIPVDRNPYAITKAVYCSVQAEPCMSVFAVHTLPPFRRDFYLHQADILQKLASEVSKTPGPVLVAGDMNAASWAPLLKRFQETAGVRKAVCGSRWTPTWLAPVPGIGLELDHFFVKDGLAVKNCELGHFNGSDHWPVFAEFTLAEGKPSD
ncbi:Endonuclease/exonuclease/phosphatase [Stappia aggregata IAM 12614]|uniref:Endonuclease/exonuclease/phosphatase n=1 Tax=Roseibium aggregatum (strain ATCC 25650 / DSM 13394 / JCM 20685 / NBRC 16684 / NCIMB 2208 / IAM 12614 / B1) TaxID=384765 RepID=A0NLL8_ROSAI|nr:endonuclease/exonuclease/phosphatase family protein [Roseibium aggregatum]EAV45963.1 Endonuclease/exonuclease/phosphatase [Stappia aggregata IAM 12614] [Roseibium aggregatum IAM 12614]